MAGARWGKNCHAAYMREWRKTHPLTPEQRSKDNCRSYANIYKRRGKLTPEPCERCGEPSQMHHPDYTQPLKVRWLCRAHHLELHAAERAARRAEFEAFCRSILRRLTRAYG